MSEASHPTGSSEDHIRFNEILDSLHKEICKGRKLNHKDRHFYPSGDISHVLGRSGEEITEVAAITTKYLEQDLENAPERIARRLQLGNIGRIFAVLLEVHKLKRFGPSNRYWLKFIADCVVVDHSVAFHNLRLPIKKDDLYELLGREYGDDFHAKQDSYSAPILRRNLDEPQDFSQLDAPLPYLKEIELSNSVNSKIYETTIEKSHIETVEQWRPSGDLVYARKDIPRKDKKQDVREWSIFQLIRANRNNYDKHVMKIFACCIFDHKVSLFMEKAHCDLAAYMAYKKNPPFDELPHYIELIANIASAIEYLHDKVEDKDGNRATLLHCDIKPENILVLFESSTDGSATEAPTFRLADFGVSKIKRASKSRKVYLRGLANTDANQASIVEEDDVVIFEPGSHSTEPAVGKVAPCVSPESLTGDGRITEKADVWSFGCVVLIYLAWLCHSITGPPAFASARKDQGAGLPRFVSPDAHGGWSVNPAVMSWLIHQCAEVTKHKGPLQFEVLPNYLLRSVMRINPKERHSMSEVRQNLINIAKMTKEQCATWRPEALQVMPLTGPETRSQLSTQPANISSAGAEPQQPTTNLHVLALTEFAGASNRPQSTQTADRWNVQSEMATVYRCVKHDARRAIMPDCEAYNERPHRSLGLSGAAPPRLIWAAREMLNIREFAWAGDHALLACLHRTNTTIFDVRRELERSAKVSIGDLEFRSIRAHAISELYLCLMPDCADFELAFFRLERLFGSDTAGLMVSKDAETSSPFNAYCLTSTAAQPDYIALSSLPSRGHCAFRAQMIACISADHGSGYRQLTILNLDLETLVTTKLESEAEALPTAVLPFDSPFLSKDSHQYKCKLTISEDRRRITWTVEADQKTTESEILQVYFWHLPERGRWQGPIRSTQQGVGYIKPLIASKSPFVMGVYRNFLQHHHCKTGSTRHITLKTEHTPIVSAATEDFKTFFLVVDRGSQGFQIVRVRRGTGEDTVVTLPFTPEKTISSAQQDDGGSPIVEASTLRIKKRLNVLLVWESRHSVCIDVDEGDAPPSSEAKL